jgi:hypothetical protein
MNYYVKSVSQMMMIFSCQSYTHCTKVLIYDINETNIGDFFIEIRELLESQQNLKGKFRNALRQVMDLDRGWLKPTLKVYASLEVFVLKEEDIDSDTDGDESEVDEEEGTEEEESEGEEVHNEDEEGSEEEEVDHGDEEGSDEDEGEEDENVGLEPFWDFVFKARAFVDENMEYRLDIYFRKERKKDFETRRKRKYKCIWVI